MTTRSTLADRAYEELRMAITGGAIPQGDVLLETELARMLGASRTPVREALMRIELEGYARRDDRGRLVVGEFTRAEYLDWFVVRRLIEEYAVRLACERISDRELRELESLITADAVALLEANVSQLASLNEQIHELLFRASRNRGLTDLVRRLRGRVYGMSAFAVGGAEAQKAFVEEHAELLHLLREGSADAAAQVIVRHMERARRLLAEVVASERSEQARPSDQRDGRA